MLLASDAWNAKCLPVSSEWSRWQKFWVVLQTLLCMITCFGVNFALSYLSFKGEDDPTLWKFPTPMSGSYAVTIFFEMNINWILTTSIMTWDVLQGKVAPISPSAIYGWPKEGSALRWWFNASDLVIPSPLQDGQSGSCCNRFVTHMKRNTPWMIYAFLATWPISVLFSWLIWGTNGYNDYPLPELLIGGLGSLIALLTIPLWAVLILGDLGDRLLKGGADQSIC
jgi:hypothetical protein